MSGARADSDGVQLVAGAAGLLWRCRLELAIVTGVAGAFLLLAGVLGDLAAAVLVLMTAVAMLAVPRPRRVLMRWLRAARSGAPGGGRGRTASCRECAPAR